jgi:hypothetical protein
MTEQLRRFNEKCLSDLVTYMTSQAGLAAKISAENEKWLLSGFGVVGLRGCRRAR